MTRFVQTPALSTRTVDFFYGMTQDRVGMEQDEREFWDLVNVDNNQLRGLKKRLGSEELNLVTHANGTGTLDFHTHLDDAGSETWLKMTDEAKLYKLSGGSWSQVGATTFTNAHTTIASISAQDTGASNVDSGTATGGTATTLQDTSKSFTVNTFVGDILVVNSEKKRIVGNDATTIFVSERFDTIPSTDSYTVNPRSQEAFLANGTEFYKTDTSTLTQLDTSNFAYAFDAIEAHNNRLWGRKGTRLHYSDIGVGEHFSRNSFFEFQTPITAIKSFGDVLIVYEQFRVKALFGNDPSTFAIKEVLDGIGCVAPRSIANYADMQLFLSEQEGVVVLSFGNLASEEGTLEPVSISEGFIQSKLDGKNQAQRRAAAGGVHRNKYYLCVADEWYVLHIEESLRAPSLKDGKRRWIWTMRDYPANVDANVLGHLGIFFVSGPQDSGQLYELNRTGVNDDDGNNISITIEKRDWNPRGTSAIKKFYKLYIDQQSGSAATVNFFADPDGTTYGNALTTYDPNADLADSHVALKFTGNPSDIKNSGRKISYKLTESGQTDLPEFEQIELSYHPGVIQ